MPKIKSCLINREMPITNIDEIDKDMLLRQSRILYPEVEDWLLNLAIEAYENSIKTDASIKDCEKDCDGEICIS